MPDDNAKPQAKILTPALSNVLMKRVYGEDKREAKPDQSLTEELQRDQRNAERIDAWAKRFKDTR